MVAVATDSPSTSAVSQSHPAPATNVDSPHQPLPSTDIIKPGSKVSVHTKDFWGIEVDGKRYKYTPPVPQKPFSSDPRNEAWKLYKKAGQESWKVACEETGTTGMPFLTQYGAIMDNTHAMQGFLAAREEADKLYNQTPGGTFSLVETDTAPSSPSPLPSAARGSRLTFEVGTTPKRIAGFVLTANEKFRIASDYMVITEAASTFADILSAFMLKYEETELVRPDLRRALHDLLLDLCNAEYETADDQVERARVIANAIVCIVGDEQDFISIEEGLVAAMRPISLLLTSEESKARLDRLTGTGSRLVEIHPSVLAMGKEKKHQAKFEGLPIIRQMKPLRRCARLEGDVQVEKDARFSSSDPYPYQPLASSPPENSALRRRREQLANELLRGSKKSISRQTLEDNDFEMDVAEEASLDPETIQESLNASVGREEDWAKDEMANNSEVEDNGGDIE
ncbi:hypothetical protein BJ508DRAFT_336845 [Ascobolus immersus RN42]|uniref:Uncharacterized protein n=1 Tax=Ascobolus immersus RN42 TaxID=1160509 RepID=A0A3N4H799_ASCIM|nr:hypothetical protein BJ508DRAFT_336845 [Ascobolus immersus RN42]